MRNIKKDEADKIIENQINNQQQANEEIAMLQYRDMVNRIAFAQENIRSAQLSNLQKINDILSTENVNDEVKRLATIILEGYKPHVGE